ncbi:hypothetical protein [Brevibacillus borstelensis]
MKQEKKAPGSVGHLLGVVLAGPIPKAEAASKSSLFGKKFRVGR